MYIVKSPYSLHVQEHTAGWEMHTHDSMIEIEVLMEGNVTQILNGHFYSLKKGAFWLSRPQDFHELTSTDEVKILNIQFQPSFISRDLLSLLLDYKNDICTELSGEDFSCIRAIADVISEEYERRESFSIEMIKRQIELMLLRVFRVLGIAPIERKDNAQNAFIEKAILYLRTHFSENPSLDTTAAHVHFNADYFAAQFKKQVGKTYYAYLTELKLEQAQHLILETDISLSVICFKCGFGNQSNFLRQFKRYFGCTPTRMRQKRSVAAYAECDV